ncbi:hypothetical protein PMAYCL1PPCAC_31884 [Pristionchus mayeri]|uniref:Membrane transporter n=1 Tax=Pristionchus mayeri TaxID=1317129 RepID=A0AAN5DH57_9BILA|nr:hypothetical protein PMAYCL1PPCAC_31884 [Pristionchus mayeri]
MRAKQLDADEMGCFSARIRYAIVLLSSASIASICSNMTTLNFTFICMGSKNPLTGEALTFNEHNSSLRGPYDYTEWERSQLQWSVAIGTLLAAWPFHLLYERYGARHVFFIAGMISTIATVLIPQFASRLDWHFYVFLGLRFMQGISFGADFAAIGLITVHWASLKQHGFFISLLTSFSQISVMFTMPVSGELCESRWGWPSVYYVHAGLSLCLFLSWFTFYRNDPAKHPLMTEVELEKIHRGKGEHIKQHEVTPVRAIMTNPVMWSVWLSAFGELMMSQFIVMYGSIYLAKALNFRVSHTGYAVAVPRFLHLMFKIISGVTSDKIKFLSERVKMIIYNTIALMISGAFFCIIGFIPREMANYALGALLIIECSTGFICGGFYKCATLVARQHSHFVLSQIQFIKCLSLFIEPLLVFMIIKNEEAVSQWRIVFLVHGILLILGNVIFCFFATAEPADFTYSKEELAARDGEMEERQKQEADTQKTGDNDI